MNRKNLTIGLFGFGCVGHGLYEVLQRTPGLKATIKRICIKSKTKHRNISLQNFTFDRNDILNDDEIDTVVELIDDPDQAFEIVKAALQKGKAVVTANKKMIAEHLPELLLLQKQYDVPLLYEASCCASIPILRNLEEYYDNDLLESIQGIVNGSTNYILTKISDEGKSFQEALLEAQQKGFAESNPRLDTGGFDSKYKLLILIAHAFGLVTRPEEIFNLGIDNLGELELNYAHEKGFKIKLVAYAEKSTEGKIKAFVLPKFVQKRDRHFSVDDVFNGIETKSYFSDTQFFVGKGAGAYPTASAVLSDISALSFNYRYEYKKLGSKDRLEEDTAIYLKIFLRHACGCAGELKNYFEEINESYLNAESGFIIGTISLKNLKEISAIENPANSIILFEIIKYEPKKKTGLFTLKKRNSAFRKGCSFFYFYEKF